LWVFVLGDVEDAAELVELRSLRSRARVRHEDLEERLRRVKPAAQRLALREAEGEREREIAVVLPSICLAERREPRLEIAGGGHVRGRVFRLLSGRRIEPRKIIALARIRD